MRKITGRDRTVELNWNLFTTRRAILCKTSELICARRIFLFSVNDGGPNQMKSGDEVEGYQRVESAR